MDESGADRTPFVRHARKRRLEGLIKSERIAALVVLCQEDAQASCCARDGGTGAALQEEASNCHELLRPKSAVVNVMVKRRGCDRVMYGSGRRAQANSDDASKGFR